MSRESLKQVRPSLTFLPREEDLLVLQELAGVSRGQILEQPFELTDRASGSRARYSLQAIIGRRAGEEFPTWYLYSGPDQDKLEWIHQTKNLDDIAQMLAPLDENTAGADEGPQFEPFGTSFNSTASSATNSAQTKPFSTKSNPPSPGSLPTAALPHMGDQSFRNTPRSTPYLTGGQLSANPIPANTISASPILPNSAPPDAPPLNASQSSTAPVDTTPGGTYIIPPQKPVEAQTPAGVQAAIGPQTAAGPQAATGPQVATSPQAATGPQSHTGGQPGAPLEGDFSKLSVESVFDSIARHRMTGCLKADLRGEPVLVYFESGVARHAQRGQFSGEDVLVELLTTIEGQFSFAPGEINQARTISKRPEELAAKAKTIIEYGTFLEKAGIKFNTILKHNQASPPESEFEDTLSRLLPVDFNTQKLFYSLADNQRTLQEIIKTGNFTRCQWIPTLYNLISSSILLRGEEKSPGEGDSLGLDRSAIEQFARSHLYSDKGIINYLALLFFIEQEFYRFECFQSPFALMIVRPRIVRRSGMKEVEEALTNQERRDLLLSRIKEVKRKADILAHYLQDDYALLLPQTSVQGVRTFAGRLVQSIMQDENIPVTNQTETVLLPPGEKLVLYVGVASLPEEAPDWVSLIAACQRQQRLFTPN